MLQNIPYLTTEQMAEVDRIAVEEVGILLVQMMENAGRSLAELARRMLGGDLSKRRIAILCGSGNNGGGGMVAARNLHNWGARIQIELAVDLSQLKDAPAHQRRILQAMGLTGETDIDLSEADLILDTMIGYGIRGDPHDRIAGLIDLANQSAKPVLALDVPSGLDATSGLPGNPCIQAAATLTLALPKVGFRRPSAMPYVGELYLADIGIPPEIYRRLGLEIQSPFIEESIVKIE